MVLEYKYQDSKAGSRHFTCLPQGSLLTPHFELWASLTTVRTVFGIAGFLAFRVVTGFHLEGVEAVECCSEKSIQRGDAEELPADWSHCITMASLTT